MVDILQTTVYNAISLNENVWISIRFSFNFGFNWQKVNIGSNKILKQLWPSSVKDPERNEASEWLRTSVLYHCACYTNFRDEMADILQTMF